MDFKDLQLTYNNKDFNIVGYIEDTSDFKIDNAYVDKKSGSIYIYKDKDYAYKDLPIIYMDDNTIHMRPSKIKDINAEFNINNNKNINNYSIAHIIEVSDENEVLFDKKALDDINSATSVLKLPINENDDPLKKIIKQVIIDKGVNLNKYKHTMTKRYNLTNLISNLKSDKPVTFRSFNLWCELLGINYALITKDSGADLDDPCDKQMYYTSENNTVRVFDKDDIKLSVNNTKGDII